MLSPNKHKLLSKLVALTFAFNTLTPVAFAADEVTTTGTQVSQTVEDTATNDSNTTTSTTTTNNLNTVRTNNSGQLALNSVQTDVLNRIAQSEAQSFKNKKLNITDEEISSLMNIPLSTTDDVEYYTQEEKDYNNLQLLIARGLNTKEKRDEALQKLQAIEELSKTDETVGGLTNTEKYVKSLLENYSDIESRAGSNSALGSAITPTDSSIIAYKTILKVAKAERQACRNDAVKNGTDPNECKLSERGQEAAQILTYLTNQQINQTTDSKKTTDATNSTASSTSTTGSSEARTCSDTTKRPAANNVYKCCPTDKPYINTSTGKCDTKTQNPTSDDDDDNDDDNNGLLNALLLNNSGNSYDCTNNPDKCKNGDNFAGVRQDKNATENGNEVLNTKARQNAKTTVLKGRATPSFMQRIGNVNIEFQDYNPTQGTSTPIAVEYINKQPVSIHIADPNTELQIKVKVNEKANSSGENKKEEKPIYVNLLSYNFLTTVSGGEQTIAFQNFQNKKEVNSFIPVLFSEQKTVQEGYRFKKINREQPYPVYIEITDGTNKVNYTVWYKVYNLSATIGEQTKNTSGEANNIEILPNDSEELDATSMNIQGKLQDASWHGDRCVLSVSGKYQSNDNNNDIYDIDSAEVSYEQINQDDCNKLGDKARSGNLEITLPDTSAYFSENGDSLDLVASTSLNPTIKDIDTNEFMTQEQFNSEFQSTANFKEHGNVEIPLGTTQDGYQVMYNPATNAITKFTDNGLEAISNQEFSDAFLNGQTIPEGTPISLAINRESATINANGHEMTNTTNKFYRGAYQYLGEAGINSYLENVATSYARVFQDNPSVKIVQGIINPNNTSQKNRQDNAPITVKDASTKPTNGTTTLNAEQKIKAISGNEMTNIALTKIYNRYADELEEPIEAPHPQKYR